MRMFTMITTEEYKELLLAQQDKAELEDTVCNLQKEQKATEEKLKKVEDELKELLLLLVEGEKRVHWTEGKYETFDLVGREEIVAYINEHYVWNGELQFKKVKENDDE